MSVERTVSKRNEPVLYHDIEQFIYEEKSYVELEGRVWLIERYATEPIDEIVLVSQD